MKDGSMVGTPTPLKDDGVRQLGWWHSQYDGKNKIHVPNHQPAVDWFSRENLHRGPITIFWGFPVSTNSHHPILWKPQRIDSPVVDVNWSSTQSSNGSSGITSSICERWQRWGKFFGWSAGKSYGLVSVLVNICSEDLVKQMLVLNILYSLYMNIYSESLMNHWIGDQIMWSLVWIVYHMHPDGSLVTWFTYM